LKKISIHYLSDGPKNTGGYFHENFWFEKISEFYSNVDFEVESFALRPEKYHTGIKQISSWWLSLFRNSNADLVLVPARCALPVLIRNLFSKNKVWVVFHSYNNKELKKNRLKAIYHVILFGLIRNSSISKQAKIVTVCDTWKVFFVNKLQISTKKIVKLPNLFDSKYLQNYSQPIKSKSIHLGMWSAKIDPMVYEIAAKLSARGYNCFFTSPIDLIAFGAYGYSIYFCDSPNEYYQKVADSLYTLSFSKIPEGWSRVAHESFLLGTPVIGSDNWGQGELIREANGFIAETTAEVLEIIELKPSWKANINFKEKYEEHNALAILQGILSQ